MSRVSELVERVSTKKQILRSMPFGVQKDQNLWQSFEEENYSRFSEAVRKSNSAGKYTVSKIFAPQDADTALSKFEEEISASRFILKLVDEEDHLAAPYSEMTLRLATDFVRRIALHAHSSNFKNIPPPKIRPASGGSIDLFWEVRSSTLLVNFAPSQPSYIYFFGQNDEGNEISGRFKYEEDSPELICWIARL